MDKKKTMDDTEIRISGIEALSKALGPAAAFRFLTSLHPEVTDYAESSTFHNSPLAEFTNPEPIRDSKRYAR